MNQLKNKYCLLVLGFCGETEDEFNDTLMVMQQVKYHVAFMFAYSMREVCLFDLNKSVYFTFFIQFFCVCKFSNSNQIALSCFLFENKKKTLENDRTSTV